MTGAEANVSNLHCSLEQQEHVTNEYNWVDWPKVDYQIKQDE